MKAGSCRTIRFFCARYIINKPKIKTKKIFSSYLGYVNYHEISQNKGNNKLMVAFLPFKNDSYNEKDNIKFYVVIVCNNGV